MTAPRQTEVPIRGNVRLWCSCPLRALSAVSCHRDGDRGPESGRTEGERLGIEAIESGLALAKGGSFELACLGRCGSLASPGSVRFDSVDCRVCLPRPIHPLATFHSSKGHVRSTPTEFGRLFGRPMQGFQLQLAWSSNQTFGDMTTRERAGLAHSYLRNPDDIGDSLLCFERDASGRSLR